MTDVIDKTQVQEAQNERVLPRVIEDVMKKAYIDYSMSVIVSRALPDARDGLKPVHRRILYAMQILGLAASKPFRKSAFIVGRVMAGLHPHGDASIYDALVRMAQSFSLRYQLVHGQGNFGSIDGDNAAAPRYTEAKLQKLAEDLLNDLDKDTVDFRPNYDNTATEPTVLPSKAPNMLLNGASGIAVGMATNIPPHNMNEVCDATIALIDNPEMSIPELNTHITGPDFPTGGIICGTSGIKQAYETGRGKLRVKARTHIEETKKGKQKIIIDEIPYQVNKSMLIKEIADLVNSKKITGISDLRDESDREHAIRIVIELKSNANTEVILNQLYAHSRMKVTFGIIMLALVDNQPRVLTLKESLEEFVLHRRKVIRRRTEYEKKAAEKKAHLLEGLIIALDNIDSAIKLIKSSKSTKEAKEGLMDSYKLTDLQAQAILDMKLQKLTSLEQGKIRDEHKALMNLIERLKEILADENRILNMIKTDLEYLKNKYGDERKTTITLVDDNGVTAEELIKPEDMVVTITHAGYVKRLTIDTYKQQKRGGRGVMGAGTKEKDFLEDLFIANTRSSLLLFTNKGKVHWLKVYQIPETGRTAKGTPIVNLVSLDKKEIVTAYIPIKEFKENEYLMMATKYGVVKKCKLSEFKKPRNGGIKAIGIPEEDELVSVILTDGNQKAIIGTQKGKAIHFDEKGVRSMGRTAYGVIGIKLKPGDLVIGMIKAQDDKTLLTVTKKGYGKRTDINEYRITGRGGTGVINLKITEKNGDVVAIKAVDKKDEAIIISQNGIVIRMPVKGISDISRNTQGLRLMKLADNDQVVSAAKIIKGTEDEKEEITVEETTDDNEEGGKKEVLNDNTEEKTQTNDKKEKKTKTSEVEEFSESNSKNESDTKIEE